MTEHLCSIHKAVSLTYSIPLKKSNVYALNAKYTPKLNET